MEIMGHTGLPIQADLLKETNQRLIQHQQTLTRLLINHQVPQLKLRSKTAL